MVTQQQGQAIRALLFVFAPLASTNKQASKDWARPDLRAVNSIFVGHQEVDFGVFHSGMFG